MVDRYLDEQLDGLLDEQIDAQIDGQLDIQLEGQLVLDMSQLCSVSAKHAGDTEESLYPSNYANGT